MKYRLRGHHLICLQFFKGEGYNRDFTENLQKVVEAWDKGFVEVIEGADDVCLKCPNLKEGQCVRYGEGEIRKDDELALKLLGVRLKDKVEKKAVKEKLQKVIAAWKEEACRGCDWEKVCFSN